MKLGMREISDDLLWRNILIFLLLLFFMLTVNFGNFVLQFIDFFVKLLYHSFMLLSHLFPLNLKLFVSRLHMNEKALLHEDLFFVFTPSHHTTDQIAIVLGIGPSQHWQC